MPNHPMKDPVTWLYPAIEPYNTGRLQVSPVHELYYEESGNPGGKVQRYPLRPRTFASIHRRLVLADRDHQRNSSE